MHRQIWISLASVLVVAGCASGKDGTASREARDKDTLVAAGDPVTCVDISRIRETRVRDDRTIDFRMTDGTVLRNSLPNSCPGLGFERSFAYSTSLSRLCNVDIITVLQQGGGPRRGASCGLGQFTPMKEAAPAAQ